MSYKIVFSGKIEERYLDSFRGRELAEKWKNDDLPEKFSIGDDVYETKAIKAIIADVSNPDRTQEEESNAEKNAQVEREFQSWRSSELLRSADERGSELAFARFIWQSVKGVRPTEAEEKDIQEKSTEWLRTHPDFHRANPVAYLKKSDLVVTSREGEPRHIKDQIRINGLLYAERHLNA